MAITEYTINASVGTTEYSVTNNSTTLGSRTEDGIMQAHVDLSAMTAADQYRIRVYEKTRSASSQKAVYEAVVSGTQPEPFITPSLVVMHGWDVSITKVSGTDRTIEASVRLLPIV
jgi:hypothetical protein